MVCTFEKFVKEEIETIMGSIDDDIKKDPLLFQKAVIEWIDNNAERYRRDWEEKFKKDKSLA